MTPVAAITNDMKETSSVLHIRIGCVVCQVYFLCRLLDGLHIFFRICKFYLGVVVRREI